MGVSRWLQCTHAHATAHSVGSIHHVQSQPHRACCASFLVHTDQAHAHAAHAHAHDSLLHMGALLLRMLPMQFLQEASPLQGSQAPASI
jgi:hypothetical protein